MTTQNRKRLQREETPIDAPSAKRGRKSKKQTILLSRYPAIKNTIDDEVSFAKHCDALHKELKREKPRKELVLSLARQTFSVRREHILDESNNEVTSAEILTKYEELQKSYVASHMTGAYLAVQSISVFNTIVRTRN